MIIRPSLFKCDWFLFSIWKGVIVNNQTVWDKSGISPGDVWESLGQSEKVCDKSKKVWD